MRLRWVAHEPHVKHRTRQPHIPTGRTASSFQLEALGGSPQSAVKTPARALCRSLAGLALRRSVVVESDPRVALLPQPEAAKTRAGPQRLAAYLVANLTKWRTLLAY